VSEQGEAQSMAVPHLDLARLELLILDAVSGPAGASGDPGYVAAERAAVAACLECWNYAVERGEEWTDTAPVAVKLHARRAARAGIELSALFRSYSRTRDLAWRETISQLSDLGSEESRMLAQRVWVAGESLLNCVQDAVEAAYRDEMQLAQQTPEQQQARLVSRLLQGDQSVDLRLIDHDFTGRHLGMVWTGGATKANVPRMLAERSGCQMFCLPEQEGLTSGWLRLSRELRPGDLERWLPRGRYPDLTIGAGRMAESVEGFCETHRLAHEAFLVAQRRGRRIAWHADVELDALLLRDLAFARSLIANYIDPLDAMLLQTLRICHDKDWNESATARALGKHRSTVSDRLERIGKLVGRPVSTCRFSLELAQRATELLPAKETAPDKLSTQQPAGF
jgi:PucR C-terminal helix-turn-helix domain